MNNRLITGLIFLPIFIYGLFGFFAKGVLWTGMAIIASLMCLDEIIHILDKAGYSPQRVLLFVFNSLLCLLAYGFCLAGSSLLLIYCLAVLMFFFTSFVLQLFKGSKGALSTIIPSWFAFIYISIPFSIFILLLGINKGNWLLLFLFLASWGNDIGSYYIGTRWGKLPLAPNISPKKTLEGALGGILSGVILIFVVGLFLQLFRSSFYAATPSFVNYVLYALASLLLCAISQIGDLCESLLKREVNIKDSGNHLSLITGHGGVLDIVDGILFALPLLLFLHPWLMN